MKKEICLWHCIKSAVMFLVIVTFTSTGLSARMGLETISFEEVGEKLKLSDEQVTQLKAIQSSHRKKLSSLESKINQANDRKSRKALVDAMRKLTKEGMAEVQKVLTGEHFDRLQAHLGELRATKQKEMKNDALADLQERLGLTPEQVLEIQPLMAVYQPQISAIKAEVGEASGLLQKRKAGSNAKKLSAELDEEIKEILTGTQYSAWEAMAKERRTEMRETLGNR